MVEELVVILCPGLDSSRMKPNAAVTSFSSSDVRGVGALVGCRCGKGQGRVVKG